MKYAAPPYMHDVLPIEPDKDSWRHAARWRAVEGTFRKACRLNGYREIRTPVMEATELFTRSIGEGTDIVSKEMFTFTDRGDRSMTLRPEGTAPVIRACVESSLLVEGSVTRVYYINTFYRYERGQKGRYREHQQTGVEALGSDSPAMDAEVIALAVEVYRRLGITETALKLNSVGCAACRPAYRAALVEYATNRADSMSEDNRTRLTINPLRMLDSKDPRDIAALAGAPTLQEFLCDGCRGHQDTLLEMLRAMRLKFSVDPQLVRGFDYYTRTAFEVVSPHLGAQSSLGGGGRYDGLVAAIGGPDMPGIGFGIGTERCLLALEQLGAPLTLDDERPDAFIVVMPGQLTSAAVALLHALRLRGIAADMDYAARSIKSQMRQANRLGAHYAVILGDEEMASGAAAIKDLRDGGDQVVQPLGTIAEWLSARCGGDQGG